MIFQLSYFTDLTLIGEGEHASVYKAKYKPNGYIFSLKEIEIYDLNEQSKDLKREIDIMSDICTTNDLPRNFMRFYGSFQENNKIYLVLEYIKGENLLEFSQRYSFMQQYLHENLVIIILKGIINGLIYLCGKKILHRDITPNNIMIDDNYNIKITDFGISAYKLNNYQNNQNQININSHNSKGTLCGKYNYISPEIFYALINNKKTANYDFKTDIYSLGVTMFYLMTFKLPYEIKNKKERIKTDAFIDPNRFNQQLINIIMRMLDDNPHTRPSCYDVFNELSYLIGPNNMNINYQIKLNDINLKENYLIKKSAFFSAIYSLYNISAIKSYFETKLIKDTVQTFKKKSPELAIVIDSFIEVISELKKQKNAKNKLEAIVNFMDKSSKKIITFIEYNKINPQLIIENLFDYFHYNITNMFVYNNKIAFKIYEIINKDKDGSPIIKQKVEEFKNNYSNIFADLFYFIISTKKSCPYCHFLIEEEADIEYEIEFPNPGHIKELFEDFEVERNYSNLGKNGKICKKCGIMPINLILKRSIFSAPNVLILHFGNDNVEIEENIEIKENLYPNKNSNYTLSSVIMKEEFNNNYRYKVAIYQTNIDSWIYYTDDDSIVLSFKELLSKGIICTAFYKRDE